MGSGNHEQLRVEHSNSPPERKPGFSAPLKKKTSAEITNNVSEESVSIIDSVTSDVQSTPHVQLLWRGSFSVSSISDRVRVFKQIQGHPSVKAEPKVWEIARSMPGLLNSREFRRDIDENTWHECFHSLPLSVENVDVFFFPVDMDSYDCWYKPLIDRMISYDLVLRVDLPNATLLVFHSQLLREVDRLWEDRHYLWGVFRDKEHHVIQREAPLYHAEGAGDNAEVVDMEIDMVGCDDMHASTIIIGENVLNPSSKHFPIEVSPLPLGFQPVDTKMPAKNTNHEDSLVGVSLPPGFQPVHTKMLVKNTNPEDSLVEVSLPPGFQPVDTKMPVQNTNHEDSTPPLPADAPLPAGFAPVDTMPQVKNAVFKAFIPPLPSDSLFPPGFAPPNMFQQSKSTNCEVFVPPLPLGSPPWHRRFTPENMWQFKNTNHEVRNPPLPAGTMRGPVFTPVGNLMQFKINCEMLIPPLPPGPPPPEPPPPEPPPP
ncbi:hypothetical protein KP509_1Z032800 [Ceratopteris richardii]|nr:hypothetical protein KP509_1Z032800 [Ceratopteris richardii]